MKGRAKNEVQIEFLHQSLHDSRQEQLVCSRAEDLEAAFRRWGETRSAKCAREMRGASHSSKIPPSAGARKVQVRAWFVKRCIKLNAA